MCVGFRGPPKHLSHIYKNMQAYCMKCKKRQDMAAPKLITMANGRNAMTGTCSACGSKVVAIVGAPPSRPAPSPAKGGCNSCGKR